jgi:DNA-binding XRE family transcriptional regulator
MASTDSTNLPASRNPATRPGATDFDRRLGLKIRQRRILLGISQQRLAELIGSPISRRTSTRSVPTGSAPVASSRSAPRCSGPPPRC